MSYFYFERQVKKLDSSEEHTLKLYIFSSDVQFTKPCLNTSKQLKNWVLLWGGDLGIYVLEKRLESLCIDILEIPGGEKRLVSLWINFYYRSHVTQKRRFKPNKTIFTVSLSCKLLPFYDSEVSEAEYKLSKDCGGSHYKVLLEKMLPFVIGFLFQNLMMKRKTGVV